MVKNDFFSVLWRKWPSTLLPDEVFILVIGIHLTKSSFFLTPNENLFFSFCSISPWQPQCEEGLETS